MQLRRIRLFYRGPSCPSRQALRELNESPAGGEEAHDQFICTSGDLLRMLDVPPESRGGAWWGGFAASKSRSWPFFAEWPDENLAELSIL